MQLTLSLLKRCFTDSSLPSATRSCFTYQRKSLAFLLVAWCADFSYGRRIWSGPERWSIVRCSTRCTRVMAGSTAATCHERNSSALYWDAALSGIGYQAIFSPRWASSTGFVGLHPTMLLSISCSAHSLALEWVSSPSIGRWYHISEALWSLPYVLRVLHKYSVLISDHS